jgi:hypothetical protein
LEQHSCVLTRDHAGSAPRSCAVSGQLAEAAEVRQQGDIRRRGEGVRSCNLPEEVRTPGLTGTAVISAEGPSPPLPLLGQALSERQRTTSTTTVAATSSGVSRRSARSLLLSGFKGLYLASLPLDNRAQIVVVGFEFLDRPDDQRRDPAVVY